jgi:endonuclease/exonuclease/phosphatase (EEP) superfamily protein YafD
VLHTWHEYLIIAATFIPLLWVPLLVAVLGLMLLLRARWRLLTAALALVLTAVTAWPMLPGPERSDSPELLPEGSLTVLSSNVEYGGADVEEISRLAQQGVDAIALQEVTPDFEDALVQAGLFDEFPHHVGTASEGAKGSLLLSRTPLELIDSTEDTVFDNLLATTTVDGVLWHLAVVHTAPPQMGAKAWTEDAADVGTMVDPYTDQNLLLVGDFNAIEQHHTMRELTADGALHSLAVHGRGRGEGLWEPTWPVGGTVPLFARIDHALVGRHVSGPRPVYATIPGTDHRALRVTVSPAA